MIDLLFLDDFSNNVHISHFFYLSPFFFLLSFITKPTIDRSLQTQLKCHHFHSQAFNIAMSSPPSSGGYMMSSVMSTSMTQSFYPGMDSDQLFEGGDESDINTIGQRMEERIKSRIPIVRMDKKQLLFIQIKNNDQLPGPSVCLSLSFTQP